MMLQSMALAPAVLASDGYRVVDGAVRRASPAARSALQIAMAETACTHNLEKRGRGRTGATLEHWARYASPALLLAGFAAIVADGLAAR